MDSRIAFIRDIPEYRDSVLTLDEPTTFFLYERKARTEKWIKIIKNRIRDIKSNVSSISRTTGISQKTVRKWLSSIPAKRDSVISLGYALGYDEAEINSLLDLALHAKLYVKNPDDAIWIYIINNVVISRNETLSAADIHESYRRYFIELFQGINLSDAEDRVDDGVDTLIIENDIKDVHSDQEFRTFILNHEKYFRGQYNKLRNLILDWFEIDDNTASTFGLLHRLGLKNENQTSGKVDDAFSYALKAGIGDSQKEQEIERQIKDFSSIFYKPNRIRLDVPKRDHIIALGIYLAMPVSKINEMLSICGFTSLGEADLITEAAIIYILSDVEKTDPDVLGIPELDLKTELQKTDDYGPSIEEIRRRAQDDWGRMIGIAPLKEVKHIYYEYYSDDRTQFRPFSIADYIASRIEESQTAESREISADEILKYL